MNENLSVQPRNTVLDIIKGLGILLVVAGHMTGGNIRLIIDSFHMPLFFIVGGVLLKGDSVQVFCEKNKKLLKWYLEWSAIFLLVDLAENLIDGEAVSIECNLLMTLSGYGVSVLWFFPSLFIAKLLAGVVKSKNNNDLFTGVFGFVIVFLMAIPHTALNLIAENLANGNATWRFFACCISLTLYRGIWLSGFVLIGIMLKKLLLALTSDLRKQVPLTAVAMVALIFVNIFFVDQVDYRIFKLLNLPLDIVKTITGFICILGLALLINATRILRKLLIYFGQRTVIIMVTHILVIDIFCNHLINKIDLFQGIAEKAVKFAVFCLIQGIILILYDRIQVQQKSGHTNGAISFDHHTGV